MLPEQFTDRRQPRPGAPDFDDSVCWHLLLGDLDPVRAIVAQAQQRLTGFTGLHMTPCAGFTPPFCSLAVRPT